MSKLQPAVLLAVPDKLPEESSVKTTVKLGVEACRLIVPVHVPAMFGRGTPELEPVACFVGDPQPAVSTSARLIMRIVAIFIASPNLSFASQSSLLTRATDTHT